LWMFETNGVKKQPRAIIGELTIPRAVFDTKSIDESENSVVLDSEREAL
jgi:hypothetical protein